MGRGPVMFRTQPLPEGCLPPEEALPETVFALPELRYPPSLNLTQTLLDDGTAKGWGRRTAYYYQGQAITYDEVAREVRRAANGLRSLGVGLGDRVLLRMQDKPETVYALLAIILVGGIAMPTYPMLSPEELAYRANDAEAMAIICDAELLGAVEQARSLCPSLRHVVAAGGVPPNDALSYEELLRGQPDQCQAAATGRDDIAMLIYTSGTTGEPKGVIQTHVDHLASADCHGPYALHLTESDVLAGPPAIPFRFGTEFFVVYTLRTGCASVLLPRKGASDVLAAIQQHRVTVLGGVPTFYNLTLQELASQPYDLASLRLCVCAGEPMPLSVFERWQQATGLPLTQMLGTSELGWFLGYRGPAGLKPQSLGMSIPGFAVVVRDADTFEELPSGTPGVMTVLGPTGTKYWRKPDQQRRSVRGGWTVVPDVVSRDEDGYVHYVARADEMIVSAGYNIAPAQVEQVLCRHEAVSEAACVGAPDPQGVRSAIVKAYVVLRTGQQPSNELVADLQRLVREQASPYMYPREVEFLDALPKTFNGKVRRTELKQRAWASAV